MSEDRTVLEHLLDGRAALIREITHLSSAVEELDSVIDRLDRGDAQVTTGELISAATTGSARRPATPPRSRSGRARRSAKRSATGRAGNAPKSIRVHVLEMLASEDRDFALSEIIDRVHSAGTRAHDDAVRSITTKLMKDGKVERVGRGRYRLARDDAGTATDNPPASPAITAAEPVPEPIAEPPADTPPPNLSQPSDRRG